MRHCWGSKRYCKWEGRKYVNSCCVRDIMSITFYTLWCHKSLQRVCPFSVFKGHCEIMRLYDTPRGKHDFFSFSNVFITTNIKCVTGEISDIEHVQWAKVIKTAKLQMCFCDTWKNEIISLSVKTLFELLFILRRWL